MIEKMTTRTITVHDQEIKIYYYELFLEFLKEWKSQGMSREDIEEMLLS